ncbi:MAG: GxxExxY protein [Desulfosporosinus sp.]|nr:GxxExxY protein [Desulfosporosinus sp.]
MWNEVLVELKSVSKMGVNEEAQIINDLKATGLKRGLLINFGLSSIELQAICSLEPKCIYSVLICVICG